MLSSVKKESMMEKLYIVTDHAAFEAKEFLKEKLQTKFEVIDLGTNSNESVHYPDYGKKMAQAVLESGQRGIALCGSGIGISIQVNRYKGIRAALCRDVEDAQMSRKHNDSNILCLGGRKHSNQQLIEIVNAWLETEFEGGRHQTRVSMLDQD